MTETIKMMEETKLHGGEQHITKKSIIRRGTVILKYLFLLLIIPAYHTSFSQKKIEGIYYLDYSPISIEISDGKISSITRLKELPDSGGNLYLAPGLIDNQVNGFMGVSFALGGSELTLEEIQKATKGLWEVGVTTYIPTLTTNSQDLFLKNLSLLDKSLNEPSLLGSIAGFHLEGPFISAEDGYRGAHPLQHVRKPDWNEFMEYYRASGEHILQVTLAPETEGALDFISNCRGKNIVVALGHHNAPAEVITAAIDRGAQIATHLGNGAANMVHRHHNPFWPQLADNRLMISIICDGFHLLPEEIEVFYRVKGVDKTIITSDVTSYGGLPSGKYTTKEGDPIEIMPDGKLMNLAQNGLYGSASPIVNGVGKIMKVTGCSLAEAIQMASTNPARLYGLTDRGEIKSGKRADLILFKLDDFKVTIHKTIVSGQVVYSNKEGK